MSTHILVTGFAPFSPLTRLRGNPSEAVAHRLGAMYGHAVQVEILSADANCVPRIRSLVAAEPRGILMFGAAVQVANCRLELQGATTRWGGLVTDEQLASTFAAAAADRCKAVGMAVGTAPPAPFVYWCLRSYAEALRWAEPRKLPCAFVHLNALPGLSDEESQVRMSAELLEMMMANATR